MDSEPQEHSGLTPPHPGVLTTVDPLHTPRRYRLLVQAIGILVSVALLAWVISLAGGAENRAVIQRLMESGYEPLIGTVLLTAMGIVINGCQFREAIRPLHRLPMFDVQAVNAFATMVSPLPFKISVIARVALHRKRHGLQFIEIGAWFLAIGAIAGCVTIPAALAGALQLSDTRLWVGALVGAIIALALCVLLGSRVVASNERLNRFTLRTSEMIRTPGQVAWLVTLRALDLATLAGRFWIAAWAIGVTLSPADATLAASVFVLAGIAAPSGTLGIREGAVAGLSFMPGGIDPASLATISLLVTAAEIATSTAMGIAAAIWLKPHGLFKRVVD